MSRICNETEYKTQGTSQESPSLFSEDEKDTRIKNETSSLLNIEDDENIVQRSSKLIPKIIPKIHHKKRN